MFGRLFRWVFLGICLSVFFGLGAGAGSNDASEAGLGAYLGAGVDLLLEILCF